MNVSYDREDKSRLDSFLAECLPDTTRSHIRQQILKGAITVNHQPAKAGFLLRKGDMILVPEDEPEPVTLQPQEIPLSVVYEDEDLIVVNKPKGMVVHPACGHANGTLVNALLYHCGDSLSGINGELRPGIVHRIDRDTTGLLVACKNDFAHRSLSRQLAEHSVTRRYLALVHGNLSEEEGTISLPIARARNDRKKMAVCQQGEGRSAITHYRVLLHFPDAAFLMLRLETGRTHQIRVHMAHIGHPLYGDPVYGAKEDRSHGSGQLLHAAVLGFVHPRSGKYLEFSAPLPDEYRSRLCSMLRQTGRPETDLDCINDITV